MWVGDALRLRAYWKDQPPVHVLVAGYFGIGPPKKLTDEQLVASLGVKVVEKASAPSPAAPIDAPPPIVIGPPKPSRVR